MNGPMTPDQPDPVLGLPYRIRRLPVRLDPRGPAHGTLLHRGSVESAAAVSCCAPAVLVLHGWSDYVFQREVLEHLHRRGYDVWALDLRRHGRSLGTSVREVPTAIDSLEQYDEEIGAALDLIGHHRPVLILAHSTGGLTAVRWAQRHPGTVDALILNSPWLAFHLGEAGRRALLPLVRLIARLRRDGRILPPGASSYVRAVHRDFDGDADFDLTWKPAGGHPFPASTLAAILTAQGELRQTPQLDLPTLVLHASRSNLLPCYQPRMRGEDVVLDVEGLHRAARRLGPRAELVALDGAVHDVFLSPHPVRERALQEMDRWMGRLRILHEHTAARSGGP